MLSKKKRFKVVGRMGELFACVGKSKQVEEEADSSLEGSYHLASPKVQSNLFIANVHCKDVSDANVNPPATESVADEDDDVFVAEEEYKPTVVQAEAVARLPSWYDFKDEEYRKMPGVTGWIDLYGTLPRKGKRHTKPQSQTTESWDSKTRSSNMTSVYGTISRRRRHTVEGDGLEWDPLPGVGTFAMQPETVSPAFDTTNGAGLLDQYPAFQYTPTPKPLQPVPEDRPVDMPVLFSNDYKEATWAEDNGDESANTQKSNHRRYRRQRPRSNSNTSNDLQTHGSSSVSTQHITTEHLSSLKSHDSIPQVNGNSFPRNTYLGSTLPRNFKVSSSRNRTSSNGAGHTFNDADIRESRGSHSVKRDFQYRTLPRNFRLTKKGVEILDPDYDQSAKRISEAVPNQIVVARRGSLDRINRHSGSHFEPAPSTSNQQNINESCPRKETHSLSLHQNGTLPKKKVQIVVEDPFHDMPGYSIMEGSMYKVTFNARTWDIMMQSFRLALEMDNVFICDKFLGNDAALRVLHELYQMKDNHIFDSHMKKCVSGRPFHYSTVFLEEAAGSHPQIDALILMVYKLATYHSQNWQKLCVGVSYYPNGHKAQKFETEFRGNDTNKKHVLKCIYFPSQQWDSSRDGGVYNISTPNRATSIEPSFDKLVVFWGDSLEHSVNETLREKFGIVIWLKL